MLVRRLLFFTTHEILRVFRIHLASSLIMGIKTGVSREPLTYCWSGYRSKNREPPVLS
ncbi:inorganic polyphosphate kinase [Dickeya dadantii]|nr:inorganic polyphosphate kinase [Dickeya dadantii]